MTVCIDVVSFCLIPPFKCSTHDAVDFKIHLFTGYDDLTMFDLTIIWLVFFAGYDNSTMFDLTVTWLIFSFQAMRILGPQTQGLSQTIMGPPHQVLFSGGSILYPIQISQSGPSLMSGGPVVISKTGHRCPSPAP